MKFEHEYHHIIKVHLAEGERTPSLQEVAGEFGTWDDIYRATEVVVVHPEGHQVWLKNRYFPGLVSTP